MMPMFDLGLDDTAYPHLLFLSRAAAPTPSMAYHADGRRGHRRYPIPSHRR
jgi:hypothetical protein